MCIRDRTHIGKGQHQEDTHRDGGKEGPGAVAAPAGTSVVSDNAHQRVIDGVPHAGNQHDRGDDAGVQSDDQIEIGEQKGLHKKVRELLTGSAQAVAESFLQ